MFKRRISSQEVREGCEKEFEAYLENAGRYPQLAKNADEADKRGVNNARIIPSVDLVVASALDVLMQPDVNARVPLEIAKRMLHGVYAVGRVSKLARSRRHRSDFRRAAVSLTGNEKDRYRSPADHPVRNLARAPFLDTCMVTSGAVLLLRQEGVDEEEVSPIVQRSKGLLSFAKIPQDGIQEARGYFGMPYASPEHYELSEGDDGLEVAFDEEAQEKLLSLRIEGQGCPARRLPSPELQGSNLLEERWQSLVAYMVPDGAQVSDDPGVYVGAGPTV